MVQNESSESIAALREEVTALAESCRTLFTHEELSEVDHYLDHNEPEMAFEGLLIELISANLYPGPFHVEHWEKIGQASGLPDGGVFDDAIWEKFRIWAKTGTNKK